MELESFTIQPDINKLEDLSSFTANYSLLVSHPDSAGGYSICGNNQPYIQFNLPKKPSFIHRFFTKLFLGWIWVDIKNQ